jgi:hydrogenase nickel incorporation protein HypA/HybF
VHELAIARQIVDIALESSGGARVRRIVVEVGKLSAVLPDALRFCFDLATEDTAAAGAALEIVETPGRARCRGCGAEIELDRPFGTCACGATELDWLAGDQLRVTAMEVED